MPPKIEPKLPTPSASTIFPHFSPPFVIQQPSSSAAGTPFPSRALTPRLNRRRLLRRPKWSDTAACARYRLRKKGTPVDELRSLIRQCQREVQAHNHFVTSSLINLQISLAEKECIILSRLPVPLPPEIEPKLPSPSASTIFPHFSPPFVIQQPSPSAAGTPFSSGAPTPKLNRRRLPRRPKWSDKAACARYRLRK
jgi:hypothetical protein